MEKPIRLGIIGCGEHACHHLEYIDPRDFTLVGVSDPNQKNATALIKAWEGTVVYYPTAEEMLRRRSVDAVIIASPDKFHPDNLFSAVEAGKHVFVEKPLAINLHGMGVVRAALNMAEEKKLVVTSCHPRRFDPCYEQVKNSLPKFIERFGKIKSVSLDFSYPEPGEKWKNDRSLLLDHFPHEIDWLRYVLGDSPFEAIKLADGHLEYTVAGIREDGIIFNFSGTRMLTKSPHPDYPEIIKFRFARGGVTINTSSGRVWVDDHEHQTNAENYCIATAHYMTRLTRLNQDFAASIRGEKKSYLSRADLLINTITAINLATNGRTDQSTFIPRQ